MKAILRNLPNLVSAAVLCILMLANSVYMPASFSERVLGFARGMEFDYAAWEWDAIFLKLKQSALSPQKYLSAEDQAAAVNDCMALIDELDQTQREIEQIYADPQISDPQAGAHDLVVKQERLQERRLGLERARQRKAMTPQG